MKKSASGSRGARSSSALVLDGGGLSIDEVVSVARHGRHVRIGAKAARLMKASRAVVDRAIKSGEALYGINTGFGSLSKQRISDGDLAHLQRNLVRSHAAGVGEPLPTDVVRGMMLLLAASLSRGLSGVRPVVAETIASMLNAGITPVVPSIGSVGASGDLAPLAHVALVALGEGAATIHRTASVSERPASRPIPGGAALRKAGITPLTLGAKEGLALINGTHLMAAQGTLLASDFQRLVGAAERAVALSIDACRATSAFLDDRLYVARAQLEPRGSAESILRALEGSAVLRSHVENDPRVQDPYSLRAAPTVLGACQAAAFALEFAVEAELRAVTDNPLVFPRGRYRSAILEDVRSPTSAIISGANFHGAPLALPLDYLSIALCHLAGISERRIYLMTGAFEPESHLKPFLAPRPGLQSGLMIAQYTAAACVNEMVGLAAPASVANIPTSAGMEDYNSFGPRAAAKARRALELAEHVVAIEFLCAAQGLEAHRPLRSGKGVEAAHRAIRSVVPTLTEDRPLTRDIEAIVQLIRDGSLA
ncbi:MAG: histidine ammonia-lyase [Phycisphaerales bacterium]